MLGFEHRIDELHSITFLTGLSGILIGREVVYLEYPNDGEKMVNSDSNSIKKDSSCQAFLQRLDADLIVISLVLRQYKKKEIDDYSHHTNTYHNGVLPL